MTIHRSISEIRVKGKTGTRGRYSYTVMFDLTLTDSKWWRKNKISVKTIEIEINKSSYSSISAFPVNRIDKDDVAFISRNKIRIKNMAESIAINECIKSKNECCYAPDLECKTCITNDEQLTIKSFENWIKLESKKEQRRTMAKQICKEMI